MANLNDLKFIDNEKDKLIKEEIDIFNIGLEKPTIPSMNTIPEKDQRSRFEKKEDFQKVLDEIDKDSLIDLKVSLFKAVVSQDVKDLTKQSQQVQNVLDKFILYIDNFEGFNSEESRKISFKEQELKLEANHDFHEKKRLFGFRVAASVLFIVTLFLIGSLEHNVEWLRLPLSKYIKPVDSLLIKSVPVPVKSIPLKTK